VVHPRISLRAELMRAVAASLAQIVGCGEVAYSEIRPS
jgi:hypothetical protein